MKSQSDVLMLKCRSWVICRWRCWSQCWWGRSWCCMWLTQNVMITALQSHSASLEVLRDERSHCCPQFAHIGIRPWLAGRNLRRVSGSDISWRS